MNKVSTYFKNLYSNDFLNNVTADSQKLWKDYEKPKFRFFVFLALSTFIFATITTIISLILITTLKTQLLDFFIENVNDKNANVQEYYNNLLTFYGVMSGIVILVTVFFAYGIYNSYTKKSFLKLQTFPTLLLTITTFLRLVDYIMIFTKSGQTTYWNSAMITLLAFSGSSVLLTLLLIPLFYRKIKFIKIAFHRSFILKQSEEFSKMFSQNEEYSNLFGNLFGGHIPKNQTETDFKEEDVTNTEVKNNHEQKLTEWEKNKERLMSLNNEKLFGIAQKLYIHGYDKMSKEELVDAILNIVEKNKNDENK